LPQYSFGNPEGFNPYAARWYWRALAADKYGNAAGYTITPKPTVDEIAWDKKLFVGDKKSSAGFPKVRAIAPGTARGRIIGGNLSVVHALMGTPYEIQTDGKLLFLEDVGEAPYRVDRMLSTMKLAGKFDHVAGVILGSYSRRKDEAAWDEDWTMDDVLDDYFANLGVPAIVNFPAGHLPFNTTLPIGAEAELDAAALTVRMLENPVQIPPRANANTNR
jgi:muramoyltetrapeptide carboxypeptidase